MAEEPVSDVQLLRIQKAKLIEILSADADFVLQHADSRFLLSRHGYGQVKACRVPSEKMTELLDHIIQRGPEAAQGLIRLLKDAAMQEAFPMLRFMQDQQVNPASSGRTKSPLSPDVSKFNSFLIHLDEKETSRKRQAAPVSHDSAKKICNAGG